jgi:hypothetical protein
MHCYLCRLAALSAVVVSEADCLLTDEHSGRRARLIARVFAVPGAGCSAPNFATIDLLDLTSDPPPSALAALDYEAAVELDGVVYYVGGFDQTCPEYRPLEPRRIVCTVCLSELVSSPREEQRTTSSTWTNRSASSAGPATRCVLCKPTAQLSLSATLAFCDMLQSHRSEHWRRIGQHVLRLGVARLPVAHT